MEQVLAFIEDQEPQQRLIIQQLRQLILEAAPHVEESIKWNIPFYAYKGLLCYLNPTARGVVLGFCKGALLSNEKGLLEGNGKEVRLLYISSCPDCPQEEIRQLLQEALLINETMQHRKNYYV